MSISNGRISPQHSTTNPKRAARKRPAPKRTRPDAEGEAVKVSRSRSRLRTRLCELNLQTRLPNTHDKLEVDSGENTDAGDKVRLVQPTGLVYLGGTGVQIGRRTIPLFARQNTHHLIEHLVIDTDESALNGNVFTDDKVLILQTGRVKNVLANPDMHQPIVDRVDLDDPEQRAFYENMVAAGKNHAGQVRPHGLMTVLSEYAVIRNRIAKMVGDLTGSLARLRKQVEADNTIKISNRLVFYLVFSGSGGTGSSTFLEIAAIIKSLAKNLDIDIVPICIAPSAFEFTLQGRGDQLTRIKASTFATIQELAAFQGGFSNRFDVPLGPDEVRPLHVSAGLFRDILWVERRSADGRDLGSDAAVYDTVSKWLAAMVGTELRDVFESLQNNEGQDSDPQTQMPRIVSTLGARALTLDSERISTHLAQTAIIDFTEQVVLGSEPTEQLVQQWVTNWINNPRIDGFPSLDDESMVSRMRKAVSPAMSSRYRALFNGVKHGRVVYFSDRQFGLRFSSLRERIDQDILPDCDAVTDRCFEQLEKPCLAALKFEVARVLTDHGLNALIPFAEKLRDVFAARGKSLIDSSTNDRAEVRKRFAVQDEVAAKFSRRRFRFWKAKTPQSRLSAELSSCTNLAVEVRAQRAIGQLLLSLSALADDIARQARENCQVAATRLLECERIREESRSGQRITTDSLAEIDVASPSTDDQLYSRFLPEWAQFGPSDDLRADWLCTCLLTPISLKGSNGKLNNCSSAASNH